MGSVDRSCVGCLLFLPPVGCEFEMRVWWYLVGKGAWIGEADAFSTLVCIASNDKIVHCVDVVLVTISFLQERNIF